jgi:hypothetical protein
MHALATVAGVERRERREAHQRLPPQPAPLNWKAIGMLKPVTRLRLHWRKPGFEKSHSSRVQPVPSGWLHWPVWPKVRPACHYMRNGSAMGSTGSRLKTHALGHGRRRALAVAERLERIKGAVHRVQHWRDSLRAVIHLTSLSKSVLLCALAALTKVIWWSRLATTAPSALGAARRAATRSVGVNMKKMWT